MDPTFKGLGAPLPQKRPSSGPSFKLVFVLLGGGIVLFLAMLIIGNMLSSDNANDSQRLLYRLDTLKSLTTTAAPNITDDTLAAANASLSLVLSGDITAVRDSIPLKKQNKELTTIKSDEADEESLNRLKDAKINGTYNSTYRALLREKLQETYILSTSVAKRATKSQKEALEKLQDDLNSYYRQLEP